MSAYVRKVLQEITATIAVQLAACKQPWQRPWGGINVIPRNILSHKPYSGSNRLILWAARNERRYKSRYWGTLNQWNKRRATVRRGEKSTAALMPVLRPQRRAQASTGVHLDGFRIIRLFNGDQINGYFEDHPDLFAIPEEVNPDLEDLMRRLPGKVIHGGDVACYKLVRDEIWMPWQQSFRQTPLGTDRDSYYSTLFHEYCHWTGHPSRLARTFGKFGDEAYAFEELIAELGSAFVTAEVGQRLIPRADHAAYIKSWLRRLQDDETYLLRAAGAAQKACDFLKQYLDNPEASPDSPC